MSPTFEAGLRPHSEEINTDIKNFTDIVPVTQISLVVPI
jgi:hypothetical protein